MDINELKDKAFSSFGKMLDSGVGLANRAADRARTGARIAKLNMEISSEKENLRKTYLEIGKLYYDTHKDDPEGFFIQLCDEVALAERNIAEKEEEIETLRQSEEDIEDADFESVVADTEESGGDVEDSVEDSVEVEDELESETPETPDEPEAEPDEDSVGA